MALTIDPTPSRPVSTGAASYDPTPVLTTQSVDNRTSTGAASMPGSLVITREAPAYLAPHDVDPTTAEVTKEQAETKVVTPAPKKARVRKPKPSTAAETK
jgi:hypothetical protein